MEDLITQFSNLILSQTGTLFFYLVVSFVAAISLQMVLRKNSFFPALIQKRTLLAMAIIFIACIIFLIANALAGWELINSRLYLPLAERVFMAFILLWLAWIWCFPLPRKSVDIGMLFLNVLFVLATFFTFSLWQAEYQSAYFNHSLTDWIWNIIALGIVLTGGFLLILKRPNSWGPGFAAMVVPAIAMVLHLFWLETPGDFSGLFRLSVLFSFSVIPQLIAEVLTINSQQVRYETNHSDIEGLNKYFKTLAESNPKVFQQSIPRLLVELSGAEVCFIGKNSLQTPRVILERYNSNSTAANETPFIVEVEPEDIPHLSHALESQFILTFEKAAGFRDEFRQLGKKINAFGIASVLVLPYPIQPETKICLILLSRTKNAWNEVSQAELSSTVNSLLLIFHQKQREEQLQKSIQRLLESKQPDFRSITSFNYQNLQQEFNQLTQKHESLQDRFANLQSDLQTMADSLETMSARSDSRHLLNDNIHTLKSWLDQAQTQNSLLQAELEQVLREKQALALEIEHYREARQLSENYAYLKPQESLPLDETTNLNDTLARAQELLFKITEMNNIFEQNQVQSVVVLESIQEQVTNLHQFQKDEDDMEDGESFLIQAEYFLEDIRTAQSVLKEQSRLQKMLEESFLNSLKMKDHFDHLTQINHRNYQKINQIYQQLQKHRSKSEEATIILSNIQEENEKLRVTMLDALAKNQGDSLTIENLQSEMLTALDEINILKDKLDQKQDMIHNLQIENEMISEGVKENNQIIISLIQDILQPISTITGCVNLLSSQMPEDHAAAKLIDQVYSSLRTIQDQVNKLIACTERNSHLLSPNKTSVPVPSATLRPSGHPEELNSYD